MVGLAGFANVTLACVVYSEFLREAAFVLCLFETFI